jgi:hypothetical protein
LSMGSSLNLSFELFSHPRVQGTMQAFAGLAEAGAGSLVTFETAGIAAPIGWPILIHGIDQLVTGTLTAMTGRYRATVTEQLLQKTGLPPQWASFTNDSLTIYGTMGGAALVRAGRLGSYPNFNYIKKKWIASNKKISYNFSGGAIGHVEEEIGGFDELSTVSGRFSASEEVHKNCPGVYYNKEELRLQIIETKRMLKQCFEQYHEQKRLICKEIQRILLKEWDPIGIQDIPHSQDEYDLYLDAIYEAIVTAKSERLLFNYIWMVERENMGLSGDIKHTRAIAHKLFQLRNYSASKKAEKGHPCPCCGDLTRSESHHGTLEICPVCYWEDDYAQFKDPDFKGGANRATLAEGRSNFKNFGACLEKYVKQCTCTFTG